VPVDGSEGSLRAARFAASMSASFQTPMKLAHVVAMTPESVMGLSRLSKAEVEEIQQERARVVLEQARAAVGDAREDIPLLIMAGDPAEEILHYVEKNPGALVIMGRRGLSPVKSLMLGSVSDKVLRSASGTVAVVN